MEVFVKRNLIIIFFLFSCLFIFPKNKDIPYKKSFKVNDVYNELDQKRYKIIKETEELPNDQEIKNLPESDIIGISSCFDRYRVRFDILINKDITLKFNSWFSFELESKKYVDKYTYYVLSGDLFYEKIVNGKIEEKKELELRNSKDWAGIVKSGKKRSSSVFLTIYKDVHYGGQKGSKYYVTTVFSSGYVDRNKKLKLSDKTSPVDVEFVR